MVSRNISMGLVEMYRGQSLSTALPRRLETIIYKHAESEAGAAEKLVQAKHSPAKSAKK